MGRQRCVTEGRGANPIGDELLQCVDDNDGVTEGETVTTSTSMSTSTNNCDVGNEYEKL